MAEKCTVCQRCGKDIPKNEAVRCKGNRRWRGITVCQQCNTELTLYVEPSISPDQQTSESAKTVALVFGMITGLLALWGICREGGFLAGK